MNAAFTKDIRNYYKSLSFLMSSSASRLYRLTSGTLLFDTSCVCVVHKVIAQTTISTKSNQLFPETHIKVRIYE